MLLIVFSEIGCGGEFLCAYILSKHNYGKDVFSFSV